MPTNSLKPALLGLQEPRVRALPLSRVESLVDDVLDICDLARLECDPWQEGALDAIFYIDAEGQWASTEFGILVSRQQGKGNILLPYGLAHLYLWPREDGAPKLIGHTAHEGATAREAFRRARRAILASPALRSQLVGGGKQTAQGVSGISTGNGNWSIELKNGNRIIFFTRTGGAGVGLSFDVLVVDEAQHSPLSVLEALLPATDASPNKQVLFAGTVPKDDQDGEYFEGLRDRGRGEPLLRTGWIEHTPVGSDDPELAKRINLGSPQVWQEGNPGLGIRLALKTIEDDWDRMGQTSPESFARQRLSIWPARPPVEEVKLSELDLTAWEECADSSVTIQGPGAVITLSIAKGGGSATVAAACRRGDKIAVEHKKTARGTLWVAEYVRDLKKELGNALLVLDAKNAAVVVTDLGALGIKFLSMNLGEIVGAHALFLEHVAAGLVEHRPQPEVTASFQFATTRTLVGGLTWAASDASKPITHAEAVTWAVWGVKKAEASPAPAAKPPAPPARIITRSSSAPDDANLASMRF